MSGRELEVYAGLCGAALALDHSRAGQRVTMARCLGRSDALDRAVAGFALDYPASTEREHHTFTEASAAERLEVGAGLHPERS